MSVLRDRHGEKHHDGTHVPPYLPGTSTLPDTSTRAAQQRDREVGLTTARHLADAMRRTADAMAKAAELQAQRDVHLDRIASTVGALTERLAELTTVVAVSEERLAQLRLSQETITDIQSRLRKLEDMDRERKALARAGNYFVRNWPAFAALCAAIWAVLQRKAGS